VRCVVLLALCATFVRAGFGPNVRIDRLNRPGHACSQPSIAVALGAPSPPSVYAVYEDDSLNGFVPVNTDLAFQKSTDGGATWLDEDRIVRHFDAAQNLCLDVMAYPGGSVYIVYTERPGLSGPGHVHCLRSTDSGATWSAPAQVDDNASAVEISQARIATDTAGNIFCAWGDGRIGSGHVWSSVSTDLGTTWSANVRVSTDLNDTTRYGGMNPDVFVQPGTNQYLVAAEYYYYLAGLVDTKAVCLYRSTDGGRSFQPGDRLDTFSTYTGAPHVVADLDHVICDFTAEGDSGNVTQSRTFYTGPDTWGGPVAVGDTSRSTYYDGGELAVSADGRVHAALTYGSTSISYTFSTDHGASWRVSTPVNDSTGIMGEPDIGVDSEGHAYVVWNDGREQRNEIWFSTNNPAAIAEPPMQRPSVAQPSATVVRDVLVLGGVDSRQNTADMAELLDAAGRHVMDLALGANDVRTLAPGVYFVRGEGRGAGDVGPVRKVVLTR
jgi:hypothetical protein